MNAKTSLGSGVVPPISVGQAARDLADAKGEHAQATEARKSCEATVAKLEVQRQAALEASAADRGNTALRAAVSDLDVQLEHARNDLQAAVTNEARASTREALAKAQHDDAERRFEAATLDETIFSESFEQVARKNIVFGEGSIFHHLGEAFAAWVRDRDSQREHGDLVRQRNALGVSDPIRPRDGSHSAGLTVGAMLDNAATNPGGLGLRWSGDSLWELKHVFDVDTDTDSSSRAAFDDVEAFCKFLELYARSVREDRKQRAHAKLAELEGRHEDAEGTRRRYLESMTRLRDGFTGAWDRQDAIKRLEDADRARVTTKAETDRAAHDSRLTAAAEARRPKAPPQVQEIPSSLKPRHHPGKPPGEGHGKQWDGTFFEEDPDPKVG